MASENAQAIDRLEARLDEMVSQAQSAKKRTTIVGVVVILLIGGYLIGLNIFVREYMTAEGIAAYAADMVMENSRKPLTDWREGLVRDADKNVNSLVTKGFEQLPALRKEVELASAKLLAEQLSQVHSTLNKHTEEIYSIHREEIGGLIRDLQSPGGATEIEETLVAMISDPVDQSGIPTDLKSYAMALEAMAERLEILNQARELTKNERVEKDLITALKAYSQRID